MGSIKQFQCWIANLDPNFGTEPGKRRPVVIVQTDLLNEAGHVSTLICPLTTVIRKKANLLRVNLPAGTAGLDKASAVMIDQVRAIDNRRLEHKVGTLPEEIRDRIKRNLRLILDLDAELV